MPLGAGAVTDYGNLHSRARVHSSVYELASTAAVLEPTHLTEGRISPPQMSALLLFRHPCSNRELAKACPSFL